MGIPFIKENKNIQVVVVAGEDVVIEVEVMETVEEDAILVNNVKTEITFCVDIARSQAT